MFAYCNNNPVNFCDPTGCALTPDERLIVLTVSGKIWVDDRGKVHTNNRSSQLRYVNETADYQELSPVTVGPVSYPAGNVQETSVTLENSSSPNFIKSTESSIKPFKIAAYSSHKFNSMTLDVFIDSSFQSDEFIITHQIDEKTIEGLLMLLIVIFRLSKLFL